MQCTLKDITVLFLSVVIVCAFFTGSFMVIFHGDTLKSQEDFTLVYGSVSGFTGMVLQYWYGSTKSSNDKDQTIQQLAKGA